MQTNGVGWTGTKVGWKAEGTGWHLPPHCQRLAPHWAVPILSSYLGRVLASSSLAVKEWSFHLAWEICLDCKLSHSEPYGICKSFQLPLTESASQQMSPPVSTHGLTLS